MVPEVVESLEIAVATADASFTAAVTEGLEATEPPVRTTAVDAAAGLVDSVRANGVDGVVVEARVDDPATAVQRLVDAGVPAVLLADPDDEEAVAAAVEAGVDDVFPRTPVQPQCELIVERVAAAADEDGSAAAGPGDPVPGSEERGYRKVFENVSDGLVVHDPETGEIVDVNEQYCEMNGYDRTELVGENVGVVTPADEAYGVAAAQEKIQRAREEGPQLFEWRNRRSDGETFPVEVHLAVVELDGTERVLASVRDITERREMERTYQDIFENVSDGLVVHDPETGEIRGVNQQYCELTGYSREELVGSNVRLVLPEDADSTLRRALEHIERAREEGPQLFELGGERRDGDRFVGEISLSTVRLRGEERVLASVRDITERKRSKRRFRTIAERVEEIIYLANADLTEVQYVNPAYADVFGRPVDELYDDARAFIEAVHPDDREAYEAAVEAMLEDIEAGDPDDRYEFEFRIRRPDGEVRWLESTGYPVHNPTAAAHQFVGLTADVTEQRRRRETLETFHEATRELTEADSHETACQSAVRAAEEVLGFPLVSAYLYDEENGVLEPTAVTDRLEALGVDPPPFGPGDSLPWQVFVDGEAVTSSGPTADVYGPGISDPDIVLPMGSHGVMLVGAPEAALDAEDVELAQILAATLEAALNHVAGERALEKREAELRRHQERADRFERLNTIIRDIERATVEESSRAGIEEAVCERLLEVDVHDLVWVGEPAVGDEGLVPRTSAGGAEAYVGGLTGTDGADAGTGAGGHPAAAAYRTETSQVVESVATDVASGEWRKHALRHGVQSVVAVPVRYGTTTHGVLTVASAEPDAFDQATQEVLTELGRSIGYAVTVTEREQALESEGTTELSFSAGDEGLFPVRGSDAADCRVSLQRTVRRTGGSFSMFYVVEGADPATVVELANAAPSVETAQVVSADDDGTGGLVEVTAPSWFGSVFTEHGAVVREATAEGGEGRLVVEAPRGTDLRTLVEGFQERYPDTDLEAQRQRERTIRSLFELQDALRAELTDRQWESLETAYSAGYFGWPRETSGQEVADLLGVSQPTFNKHLRIAEQSAFRMLLDREYPSEDD